MNRKVKVLLAIPHPLLLAGIRAQFAENTAYFEVTEATTVEVLQQSLQQHLYVIVLLHQTFIASIGEIIQVPFIACIERPIKSELSYLLRNEHCRGYLSVYSSFKLLLRFISMIDIHHREIFWLDPPTTSSLIDDDVIEKHTFDYWEKLTPRQREVFVLWKQDYTNKEIAKVLNIATCTVVTHKENIRHALEMSTQQVKRFLSVAPPSPQHKQDG